MNQTGMELLYEKGNVMILCGFGIDNQNHVFECTSAGCGNVPEFVCRSKKNTEELLEFFINELDEFTEEKLLVEYVDTNQLLKDCI